MKWLQSLLSILAVFKGKLPPKPAPIEPDVPPPEPEPFNPVAESAAARVAHNRERAMDRLSPLADDAGLRDKASDHAARMAAEGRLYHSVGIAENVAWNYPTGEAVVAGWMKSAGHRANILGPTWTRVGIGVAESRRGELYWCAMYR